MIIAGNPTAKNTAFTIYTNAVLENPQDEATLFDSEAINFTSLMEFEFTNQVNIAYEPLENADFSTNSIQNSPYTIRLTAVMSPWVTSKTYKYKDWVQEIADTIEQINIYMHNNTILTILKNRPLFQIFESVKLQSWNYVLSPDRTALFADMTFQEIRVTTTQYQSVTVNQSYSDAPLTTLPQNQVKSPQDTSQVNTGSVSGVGQTPTPTIAGQLA